MDRNSHSIACLERMNALSCSLSLLYTEKSFRQMGFQPFSPFFCCLGGSSRSDERLSREKKRGVTYFISPLDTLSLHHVVPTVFPLHPPGGREWPRFSQGKKGPLLPSLTQFICPHFAWYRRASGCACTAIRSAICTDLTRLVCCCDPHPFFIL